MTKPTNPILMKLALETEYKKRIEDVKKNIQDRDFIIAKISLVATINIFGSSQYVASKFNLADKFAEIYTMIKDKDSTEDMISAINEKYNSSLALQDLQVLYPKDFMTYSSM